MPLLQPALQGPACRLTLQLVTAAPGSGVSWNGDSGRDEALLLPRHEILPGHEDPGEAQATGDLPGLPGLPAPDGGPDVELLADNQHPRPCLQLQDNTQALPSLAYWIPQGREVYGILARESNFCYDVASQIQLETEPQLPRCSGVPTAGPESEAGAAPSEFYFRCGGLRLCVLGLQPVQAPAPDPRIRGAEGRPGQGSRHGRGREDPDIKLGKGKQKIQHLCLNPKIICPFSFYPI